MTIIQKQRDALTITSSKIEVPASGKTITIEVQSNIQFDYEIADKDRDWILPEETRAMQTTYLTFKVQPNENVSRREGAIYQRMLIFGQGQILMEIYFVLSQLSQKKVYVDLQS